MLLALIVSLTIPSSAAAETNAEVSLSLTIPQQKTFVIGDPIKLLWRFTNRTTNAFTFMWEGCCRVNGRVDMQRQGPALIPTGNVRPNHVGVGPGIYNSSCLHCRLERQKADLTVEAAPLGPTTAHMFARPARLAAKGFQEFTSMLANWVLLDEPGDYELTGNYLGVHPKQRPQLLRRGRLWTGITRSAPLTLSLLSPSDYLAERDARSRVRGIDVRLSAPPKAIPFQSATLSVHLTNTSAESQTLHWPGEAELWIVDSEDKRLPESRYAISGKGSPISLGPGDTTTAQLPVKQDLFEGKPFGDYRVFVELKETTNAIRVPSNPTTINWNLDRDMVSQLVTDAAERPAVGLRNPPLKLLRVHLTSIADILAALNPTEAKARALANELTKAAILKQLQPQPGTAKLNLGIYVARGIAFQDPAIRKAFPNEPNPFKQLAAITKLRRHLGWSIAVNLRIDRQASMQLIDSALTELHAQEIKCSTKVFNSTATAFSVVSFPPRGTKATPIKMVDISTQGTPRLSVPGAMSWQEITKLTAPLIAAGRSFEIIRQ